MTSAAIEVQQGKPRVRGPRQDRLPTQALAALAAPVRDPVTGRWLAGNPGGRLRQAKALGRIEAESLLHLHPDAVAPWLRPHLVVAQEYVQRLVDRLGPACDDDELVALAGDVGKARLMAGACMTEGAKTECSPGEASAWREEARAWMREVRQSVLLFRAAKREAQANRPARPAVLAAIDAEAERLMAERSGGGTP